MLVLKHTGVLFWNPQVQTERGGQFGGHLVQEVDESDSYRKFVSNQVTND